MHKAVLFDFDGTFADTAHDLISTANYIYSLYGKKPISFEEGRAIASDGVRAFLNMRFEEQEEDFSTLAQEFLNHYRENILNNPILFDGVQELIDFIANKEMSWGIVTNKPRSLTESILKHYKFDSIDVLLCGDDGFSPKPAPDLLHEAKRILGVSANEVIYVGDGERDIVSANAAGMYSVLACYGYLKTTDQIENWKANMIIHQPHDLINIIT